MKPQTNLSVKTRIVVPFHDLDPLCVCWHGNYVKYLEIARTVLWQKIGYDHEEMRDTGFMYPIIEVYIRYAQPLRYQQEVEITASLVEYENRLKVEYLFHDVKTGKRLTKAYTCQVAVDIEKQEMCFVSPAIWREKLKDYIQ
jgi:acyl-CoA thioester hydrolase